jgi:hypothetical protein
MNNLSIVFICISTLFSVIAIALACVGIATPNWQVDRVLVDRETHIISTANFFYACHFAINDSLIQCGYRSTDRNIQQYYPIDARWNQTEWNRHLDGAAGLCIVGIIFIGLGAVGTVLMFLGARFALICLIGPILLFLACLFMLVGMADGAYVLYYNDYSANLYQTAHLLTIFSLFISCIAAGRIFTFSKENDFQLHALKE